MLGLNWMVRLFSARRKTVSSRGTLRPVVMTCRTDLPLRGSRSYPGLRTLTATMTDTSNTTTTTTFTTKIWLLLFLDPDYHQRVRRRRGVRRWLCPPCLLPLPARPGIIRTSSSLFAFVVNFRLLVLWTVVKTVLLLLRSLRSTWASRRHVGLQCNRSMSRTRWAPRTSTSSKTRADSGTNRTSHAKMVNETTFYLVRVDSNFWLNWLSFLNVC